jgi:mannose-6-phosphate isomerase
VVDILECTVMPYAWGSKTAIASLTGRPPSERPEAEMWMGAHPIAPSLVERNGVRAALDAIIAANPEREIGAAALSAFGPRLPFLLKVLAAAEPLSLQAHPTLERARRGFDDEEARGIPKGAPHRNYKDPYHKPELLCALGPFVALSGFRSAGEIGAILDAFDASELDVRTRGVATAFRALMRSPDRERLVAKVCKAAAAPGPFAEERALTLRLARLYPGDVGIVSALFLKLVRLARGEALYLGAGNLHAYVEGTGVEIMASSDNVLRGGLTPKHVDVEELLAVLDFDAPETRVLVPHPIGDGEFVYNTPACEFRLSRIDVHGKLPRNTGGPEILLVAEGTMRANDVSLTQGRSAFVPAATGSYTLEGEATVFRATTNLLV